MFIILQSFKSLELLRYYVGVNFEKTFKRYTTKTEEKIEQLASTVVSTPISIIVSWYVDHILCITNIIIEILVVFVSFVFGFLICYNIFLWIYRRFLKIKRSLKKYKRKSTAHEIKEVIDNFDHIACDNILVAKEFMQHFDPQKDKQLSTFYYYEIIYYAKNATDKILIILNNPQNYINSRYKNDAIDLFRIKNICNILVEISNFIEQKKWLICIDQKMIPYMQHQIALLNRDIYSACDKCDGLIDNSD